MLQEIKDYCRACVRCAETSKRVINRPPPHPLQIADAPFSVIAIDFLRPINSPLIKGNSYIMVITDYLTKWVEAIPLQNQKAKTTSRALISHVVARHGPPISNRPRKLFHFKIIHKYLHLFGH